MDAPEPNEGCPPRDDPDKSAAADRDHAESDQLRSEVLMLRIELERHQAELERALEDHAAALADSHRLLHATKRSATARVSARLKRVASAAPWSGDASSPEGAPALAGIPLSAFRCELASWPEHAYWRPDARVGQGRVTALQQPVNTRVRYPIEVPRSTVVRAGACLPARVWREAGAPASGIARLRAVASGVVAERTVRLLPAVAGGIWQGEALELYADEDGEYVLEFEVRAEEAEFPVPHLLWVAPEVICPPERRMRLPGLPRAPGRNGLVGSDATAPPDSGSTMPPGPLVSILTPVRDPDLRILSELLAGVRRQTFNRWQLCLVDDASTDQRVRDLLDQASASDPRITLRRRSSSGGISAATNDALAMAVGPFVAFLDHDDLLPPDALATVAEAISRHPDVDVLYTDEDHITQFDQRFLRYCKPQWAPDTLRSQMYTGHLSVLRRHLVVDVGGLREEFDGSQDYDLILRVTERTDRILHLDQVLYHWRVTPESAASGERAKPHAYEAARCALQAHSDRVGLRGKVYHAERPGTYRLVYEAEPERTVDVLCSSRSISDPGHAAFRLVRALEAGGHDRWRIMLTSHDSLRWETALRQAGADARTFRVASGDAETVRDDVAPADLLLFLDACPADGAPGWLRVMVGLASLVGVGAVGAEVLIPDGRIEHAGIVIGNGLPLPVYHGAGQDDVGHLSNLKTTVNRSAVSGAVMVPRSALVTTGGLEKRLGSAALADYCLRAGERGLRTIWTPDAVLHTGDLPPGNDVIAMEAFRARWRDRVPVDPFYSPVLWQERADYQVLDRR